jgi:hypothetical protein
MLPTLASSLPFGWGSRQTAMSEEELVRKGIIPPGDPLCGRQ